MSEAVQVQPEAVIEDDQQNLQPTSENQAPQSDGGEQGGDTNSELGNSVQSAHQNSEAFEA